MTRKKNPDEKAPVIAVTCRADQLPKVRELQARRELSKQFQAFLDSLA